MKTSFEKPIINSLLDTDLYTFSVCYAVLMKYPRAEIQYEFIDRDNTVYPEGFAEELEKQVKMMEDLSFTDEELKYLKSKCYYFPSWFFQWLKGYRFKSSEVFIKQDLQGHLSIRITGPWNSAIFWEVPLLATISEMYHAEIDAEKFSSLTKVAETAQKIAYLNGGKLISSGCTFSDFGTRRRASLEVHFEVLKGLMLASKNYSSCYEGKFVGTSNPHLAMRLKNDYGFDLKLIGTMSHQFISAIAAMFGPQEANFIAMKDWSDVYQADLGIFLYDTFGWKAFENNFTKYHANLFDGLRVDSGDNIQQFRWIQKKYRSFGIDPKNKSVVFSNGLDIDDAIFLNKKLGEDMKVSFGIGTKLTCNIPDVKPMNIVIKAVSARLTEKKYWNHCVKISNDEGKHCGNPETVKIYKQLLHLDE